nr:reverse transcriptase domain-containing protein [Tanacetum cinerariifolium]
MREFMVAQKSSNDFVKNQFFNLKTKVEQGQKNHQDAIQDLETKFVKQGQKNHQVTIQDLETKFRRISDQCSSRPTGSLPSNTKTNPKPNPTNDKPYRPPPAQNEHVNAIFIRSGKTYDSPVNSNAKTTIIHYDSEYEANEAEKEVEISSSKQAKPDPPPLKAYKLKISYPRRLSKEKIEERYAKFIDLIKEFRINIPLIDVLASMPNYAKFLKDLVSNKSTMEQISAAFLNEECFTIVLNKLPPKLGDPGSFLISCTIAGSVEYLALADLYASINLMPYSLYASLSGNILKPTRMGRPFLHTVDAIIRVKNKELNLGVGDDRITFLIDKAMQHSHFNDDICFCMDVIDEVTKEELDALLDDSKPFLGTSKKLTNHLSMKNSCQSMSKKFPSKRKNPSFCKHKINFEDDAKPVIQRQRRLNPNMKEVVKKEIIKLLDAGIIYPIKDSPWASPVHWVPKKGGMIVVPTKKNKLVPTRSVIGWCVCIDYRKLNEAT